MAIDYPVPSTGPRLNSDTQDPVPRDIRKTGIHPDFWYPLARSRDVKRGKTHPVTFAGEPIVLVRPTEGEVFAVENRCAHRQVPLHVGVVEGRVIKCGYHGWKYDEEGHCVSIPYMDKCGVNPNSLRSYPCREAYGLVFVYTGDLARLSQVEFPAVPCASDPKYKTRYLDRRIDCHYSFMHENLMDMNHQFLHRRFMGGIRTIFLGKRAGPNWVEADYTFKRAAGKQPLGEKFMLGKRPESQEGDKDLMVIRTGYPYQTLTFTTAGSSQPALDLWNAYVPLDREQRTNQTYGLMMIRRPSMPGIINVLWPFIVWFTNHIFAEDRWICELEQAAFDRQGEDQNHEIFPVIQALRKVLVDNGQPIDFSANGSAMTGGRCGALAEKP